MNEVNKLMVLNSKNAKERERFRKRNFYCSLAAGTEGEGV